MATVRLLHLSDLHIPASDGWRWSAFEPALLEDVARNAYYLRAACDVILVSGDLADSGEAGDIERASGFVSARPQSSRTPWLSVDGQPTLQAAGKPILFLPGNHDRFKTWKLGNPAGKEFDKLFSSGWPDGMGSVNAVPLPDKDNAVLSLVFADFTLQRKRDAQGFRGHWGQGLVAPGCLKKLVSSTREAQARKCAVVWVVHFAPEFKGLEKSLELLAGDELMKSARAMNVRHIFCGHTHKRRVYSGKKPPPDVKVHCAGTACCNGTREDTTFHLVEIDVAGGDVIEVREKTMAWNASDRDFRYKSENDFK